ncbi:MAG: hypothetical protein BGO39_16610 [Chloroflexi bacterium 54-19]|nr:MAG: hypothetical protein BGO39_16610 [Chloroflexi bacterium 54-19]
MRCHNSNSDPSGPKPGLITNFYCKVNILKKKNQTSPETFLIDDKNSTTPLLKVTLNIWGMLFCALVVLAVLGLGSVTTFNFFDRAFSKTSRTEMVSANNLSLREQEQTKLIALEEQRLEELQSESDLSKMDFDRLQSEINGLSARLSSFQLLTTRINQQLTLNKDASPSSVGATNNNGAVAGVSIDVAKGQAFNSQVDKFNGELDLLNKAVLNGQADIAVLNVQLQSFQTALNQPQGPAPMQINTAQLAQLSGNPVTQSPEIKGNSSPSTRLPLPGNQQLQAVGDSPPVDVPVRGIVTSLFGIRPSPFVANTTNMHYGLDLAVPEGTPVAVTKAGVVSYVGYDPGYGNRVEVTHQGGWVTLYGHNRQLLVKVGQPVQQGDILALSGNTGASTGPHVHYEIHLNGVAFDPLKVVKVPLTYQVGS